LIELPVNELHDNLQALQLIVAGVFNRPLRVLEVERLIRIGRPTAQSLEEQLSSRLLQENFHFGAERFATVTAVSESSLIQSKWAVCVIKVKSTHGV